MIMEISTLEGQGWVVLILMLISIAVMGTGWLSLGIDLNLGDDVVRDDSDGEEEEEEEVVVLTPKPKQKLLTPKYTGCPRINFRLRFVT